MTATLITRTLLAAAAAIAAIGTVAVPAAASDTSSNSAEARRDTSQNRSADNRRYCINNSTSGAETVTGSMLSRRTCRTRAQWLREGVELPATN